MTPPLAAPDPPDDLVSAEPVGVFLTGLAAVVDLGIIAASALDWVHLDNGQTAAIVAFVTAATALIGGVLRAKVWSPASVADLVGRIPPAPIAGV